MKLSQRHSDIFCDLLKIYYNFLFGHFHPCCCQYGLCFSPCCWRIAQACVVNFWQNHPFSSFIFQYSASGLVMVRGPRCKIICWHIWLLLQAVHKADVWSQKSRKCGCCRVAAATVTVRKQQAVPHPSSWFPKAHIRASPKTADGSTRDRIPTFS